jgi:hypothetical protein
MLRLFRAVISFEVEDGDARIGTAEWVDMQVATGGKTWWDFREPTQGALPHVSFADDAFTSG